MYLRCAPSLLKSQIHTKTATPTLQSVCKPDEKLCPLKNNLSDYVVVAAVLRTVTREGHVGLHWDIPAL